MDSPDLELVGILLVLLLPFFPYSNFVSRHLPVDGEKLSKMVSFSAVRPAERFGFLTDSTGMYAIEIASSLTL